MASAKRLWTPQGAAARAGAVLVFGLVALACARVAYPAIFSGIHPDDEGAALISLKSFLDGGALYDQVFTYYGPFYYDFWGGLFTTLGIGVTHDAGRIATMVAWLASSLLAGIVAYRLTGSVLLGVCGQLLTFGTLDSLQTEPMHPGGLVCLLLLLFIAVAVLLQPSRPRAAMCCLGVLIAALLVKINIASFALLSVALACAVSYPALSRRRRLRLGVEALFVATPLLLMREDLVQAWAREYALAVAVAALSVVIVLRALPAQEERRISEIAWLAGGLAGGILLFTLPALATGTTVDGLWDGLISQPLRQPEALTILYPMPVWVIAVNLALLAGCIALVRAHAARLSSPLLGAARPWLSIAAGLGIALAAGNLLPGLSAVDRYQAELWPVGLAWIALIPAPGRAADGLDLARRLIVALAVLQTLHAYPVAGSQVSWGAIALIPVAAICIANGITELREARRDLAPAMVAVAAVAALLLGYKVLRLDYDSTRRQFDSMVSLDLPGSHRLRVPPEQARVLRGLTGSVDRHCDTFLSLPGLNSFYLWSGLSPPDDLNWTHWWSLFDRDTQQRVVKDADPIDRLCLIKDPALAHSLAGGRLPRPGGPLLVFVRREFRPLRTIGGYELRRRSAVRG
jgi:hypothetical protein